MGLFDKFKKAMTEPIGEARKKEEPAEKPAWEPKPTDLLNVTTTANISEKSVKIEVPDDNDGVTIESVYFWEDEGVIRGLKGDEVIFEVTKRSNAFDDLRKFARKKVKSVILIKCDGDYGTYYRLKVKWEITREEAGY